MSSGAEGERHVFWRDVPRGLAGCFICFTTLLFHVQGRDPWTIVSSVLVLFTVAALSAWIPSQRTAQVDPMIALRNE
jgi:ABC-type antimicrobial peptide transport system permease subunit